MKILGIWDGHDAGAVLLDEGRLVAAANEERFTRRKLEVAFPTGSIRACLEQTRTPPSAVDTVAASTSDVAKTLGRLMPWTREAYYQVRRRHAPPGLWAEARRAAKYRMTEWGPAWWTKRLSGMALRRELGRVGLAAASLRLYDHHDCHAATAAWGSGWPSCLVVTIDGLGDGCAASVSRFSGGVVSRVARTPARHSPGVFFEHVTALLNMRELEDEGKVMALADHAAPVPDERNRLLSFLSADGLCFRTRAPGHAMRPLLGRELWFVPNEQFAFMAQRALDRACVALVRHAVQATGERRVALAGGVASNVKVNRSIRLLPEVDDVFVYPHMGDGGLPAGAALLAEVEAGGRPALDLSDLGLGPEYGEAEIERALREAGLAFARPQELSSTVADLLVEGLVVLWFQGRMEYGPRALGHRSVIARPDRPELRDRLNLVLKRRVWYQPFCPTLLESEARCAFADWKGEPNRHMTMAYAVSARHRAALAGVLNVDGSCRPQILPDEEPTPYADVLRSMRRRTGFGAVLNTSFNIHGQPLVCTPAQAMAVFVESGADALAIGPFLVRAAGS